VYKYHQNNKYYHVHIFTCSPNFTKYTIHQVSPMHIITEHIVKYDMTHQLSNVCDAPRHDTICMWYQTPSRSSPQIQLYHKHRRWIQSILITFIEYKYPNHRRWIHSILITVLGYKYHTYECMNIWLNHAYVQTTPHQYKHRHFSYMRSPSICM